MKASERQVKDFRPGLYRHWKGPLYRALFLGQDSTNRESGLKWAADWCRSHAGDATLDRTGVERKTLLRAADKFQVMVDLAGSESTQEPTVCYISLDDPHKGQVNFRELWQWDEFVTWELKPPSYPNQFAPRFDWVGP